MARALGVGDLSGRAVAQLSTTPAAIRCTAGPCSRSWARWPGAGRWRPPRPGAGRSGPSRAWSPVRGRAGDWSRRCRPRSPLPAGRRRHPGRAGQPLAALDEAVAAGLVAEERSPSAPESPSPTRWCMPLIRDGLGAGRAPPAAPGRGHAGPRPPPSPTGWPPPSGPMTAWPRPGRGRAGGGAGGYGGPGGGVAGAGIGGQHRPLPTRSGRILDAVAALAALATCPGAGPVACGRPDRSQRPAQRVARPPRPALRRGPVVEAHLLEAWQAHDPDAEPQVGAAAATSLSATCSTPAAGGSRHLGRAGRRAGGEPDRPPVTR